MDITTILDFLKTCHYIDKDITLTINSFNSPVTDCIWQLFSNREIWIVLYATVLVFFFRNLGWKRALAVTIYIALTIVCIDQSCNFCKEFCQRLRPCWDAEMMSRGLHVLEDFGNKYGFFSGHAANAAGFAVSSIIGFRTDKTRNYNHYTIWIIIWAFLVGISRIFVGKHFFGDVITGFFYGTLMALLLGKVYIALVKKLSI